MQRLKDTNQMSEYIDELGVAVANLKVMVQAIGGQIVEPEILADGLYFVCKQIGMIHSNLDQLL